MFNESAYTPEESTFYPEPVPEMLAKRFVEGDFSDEAPVVYEDDQKTIYRCFERNEVIVGIDRAKLRIDYLRYQQDLPGRPDQIRFEYTQTDGENADEQRLAVEMHLNVISPEQFTLKHRYVRPDFEKTKGLGTRLFLQMKDWLQQVANEQHRDVTVDLQTGQQGVIAWLEKKEMGFEVDEKDSALLCEVRQHPEHFDVGDVLDDDGILKKGFIFRKEVEGRAKRDAILLKFKKRLPMSPHGETD